MSLHRRRLAVVLSLALLVLSVAAAGCSQGAGNQGAGTGGSSAPSTPQIAFYGATNDTMVFWDPSDSYSNEIIAMNNIYERLLQYDPATNQFTGVLAKEWQTSPDALTWTFTLREGVKFHSGNEMTAEAVKSSIERTMKRGNGAAFIWEAVKSIETDGKYKVIFHLSHPSPLDLVAASGYAAFIFDPTVAQKNGEDWFSKGNEAGTGAYMLESWQQGGDLVLKQFPDYWQGWSGKHFSKVVYKTVPEAATKRQMLEAGQLDFVEMLPFEQVEALKSSPNVTITTTPSFQNLMAFFNTQKKPLDNVKVRQALSYAFPYNVVVNDVMKNYAQQSRGPIPKGLWGHDDHLPQYTYDLDKAKQLLNDAGYPQGGFTLTMTYASGDENERRMAELYKAELAKLGITLELKGMPWEAQWDQGKATKPQDRQDIFVMYWWPDYANPYSFLYSLFHTEDKVLFNLGYYSNPQYDQLIDKANGLAATDRQQAIQLYVQAQELLLQDAPALFMYDQEYVRAMRSNFKGYTDNPAYPNVVFFYNTYRE